MSLKLTERTLVVGAVVGGACSLQPYSWLPSLGLTFSVFLLALLWAKNGSIMIVVNGASMLVLWLLAGDIETDRSDILWFVKALLMLTGSYPAWLLFRNKALDAPNRR